GGLQIGQVPDDEESPARGAGDLCLDAGRLRGGGGGAGGGGAMGDRALEDNPASPAITRWGPTALIAVLAYAIPVQLLIWLPHVGLGLPERIAGNISIIVFDY